MSIVGISGGAISYYALAGEEAGSKGQQEKPSPAGKRVDDGAIKKNPAQTDEEKLQGIWKLVSVEALGRNWRGEKFNGVGNLGIKGDRLFSPDREIPESSWNGTFKLDTTKKPKRITISDEGPNGPLKFNGIYAIDEDELKLCLSDGTDMPFPTEFRTTEGSPFVLTTFKRAAIKQVEVVANKKNAAETDKEKLQGVWKLVRLEALGKVFGADKLKQLGDLAIDGNEIHNPDPDAPKFCYLANDDEVLGGYALAVSRWHGKFELDTGKKPKRITITGEGLHGPVKFNGIYSLDGDELRICLSAFGHGTGTERVSEFKTNIRSCLVLTTFKREKLVNAPRKFERFSAGGFQSVRGFESRGVGAADERPFRQYQIECTLVRVDPTGKELGADGKGKVLAQPLLLVQEGKEDKIFSGGQMAVSGDKDNAVEFLDFGVSVRVKVMGLNDGRVRLETVVERTEVDTTDQKNVLVRGRSVRSIARIKLGEAIKLVEKDDQGQARHWVRIKVLKEESISSRTRPAKADSSKRPTFQEVARRLGLSDINAFLFVEAVQGYRDAVPPVSDLARDFGMKEIDVFLLQEALRRDAADKAEPKESNGAGPQTNGFKSGGDFIFLNSQEYQIPIKANDQQQLKFWAGFFGH
jgi:uncharacterized protein (TIGR03067 family)